MTGEQAWRGAGMTRQSMAAVAVVVAVAATTRFWALGMGIPHALGVDEPEIMTRAVRILQTGDFNPHFFDYPGLYIYVQTAVAVLRFLAGASAGEFSSLSQVDHYTFYLWGRAVTALAGALTVVLVYQIGRRWSTTLALVAAALMAVSPNHVRESHFVLTDVPMTFFVTLTMLLSLEAHERGRLVRFALAGGAAGLAAATKYTGWVAVLMPLAGAYLLAGSGRLRTRAALAVIGGFGAAFLAGAPYTLLDLPGFLNGFASLATHYRPRPPGAEPGWLVYLKHLRLAIGWIGVALAGLGAILFGVQLVRGPGRERAAMALVFSSVFFAIIADRSLIYARYMLPLDPFVCLLVAAAIVFLSGQVIRRVSRRPLQAALVAALLVGALFRPTVNSIGFLRLASRTWTYILASRWIEQNIPRGARIVHESSSFHMPGGRYTLELSRRLISRDVAAYAADRVDYLIASSQTYDQYLRRPLDHPREIAAYRDLFGRLELVAAFRPTDDHPGPELRIYRVPR